MLVTVALELLSEDNCTVIAHANKVRLPMLDDSSRSKQQHSAWAGSMRTWKKCRLSQAQILIQMVLCLKISLHK